MIDLKQVESLARETGTISRKIDWFMQFEFAVGVSVRIMPWLYFEPEEARAITLVGNAPGFFHSGFWDNWFDQAFDTFPTNQRLRDMGIDTAFARLDSYRSAGMLSDRKFPLELILHCDESSVAQWSDAQLLSELEHPDDPGTYTRVERRAPISLQSNAGVGLNAGDRSGTLGGFIQARDGREFGVTCGHVAADGHIEQWNGRVSGKVVAASSPIVAPEGSVCNPFGLPSDNLAPSNAADCSLIEWSIPPSPTGEQIVETLHEQERIQIRGSRSQPRFVVKSLSIANKIEHEGQLHCFGSLVELRPQAGHSVTLPGDSGAWGLRMEGDHLTKEWAVMLVGASSEFSYAIDARKVLAWASQQLGQECWVF